MDPGAYVTAFYGGLLAGLIFLVWILWFCTGVYVRAQDDVHPDVVARIFRDEEARLRAKELVEMRPTLERAQKDDGSPLTKAHSRVGVGR